jgi:hypothetical protein
MTHALATAADYADALLSARRARNLLFYVILLLLLTQLTIFFLARYTHLVLPADPAAATQPVSRELLSLFLQYLTGLTLFLGLALAIVLSLTLLLLLQILIMGRLLGVSQLTRAYLTSVLLVVLLFPWQGFLNFTDLAGADFRLPGVLYTWSELAASARFHDLPLPATILKWWRFVGYPLLAIFLLVNAHSTSQRGLRRAIGDVAPPPAPPSSP